ncbi:unnamed protein product [Phyllotreta striolata]|uniref:Uncharacterized protein n=1 Tax=Phyllotreta striolata TaxID=444603 RepID=A0A9N9XRX4_PHYSR|nr:unnamed protein product [Phyllotreta striolata]
MALSRPIGSIHRAHVTISIAKSVNVDSYGRRANEELLDSGPVNPTNRVIEKRSHQVPRQVDQEGRRRIELAKTENAGCSEAPLEAQKVSERDAKNSRARQPC